jgi:hypothetical protein
MSCSIRVVLLASLCFISAALPAAIPAGYVDVAASENVPADVLYALACAESGRRMPDGRILPWPWALNVAGESRFHMSRRAAYRDLAQELSTQSNVDVGLGQISWHWHRQRLGSVWQALDPYFNLRTAARLLRAEFDRCRCDDWWVALERYHAPSDSERARQRRASYRERAWQCWSQQ